MDDAEKKQQVRSVAKALTNAARDAGASPLEVMVAFAGFLVERNEADAFLEWLREANARREAAAQGQTRTARVALGGLLEKLAVDGVTVEVITIGDVPGRVAEALQEVSLGGVGNADEGGCPCPHCSSKRERAH